MKIANKKGVDGKLDDAWSLLVKLKVGRRCEYCGTTTKKIESHHIFGRSNKSTRWDVNNGVSLCFGHHVGYSTFSAHKTPLDFFRWLYKYKGNDFVDRIEFKSKGLGKFTTFEKEIMLKELQEEIKKYN